MCPNYSLAAYRRVGLLGGAFNPAHEGHVHISRVAQRRLALDCIWWLVSPSPPLKSSHEIRPLQERMRGARTLTHSLPFVHVMAPELESRTRYTVDTLAWLKKRFARTRFVWLMGADQLAQFALWHRWSEVVQVMPMAVMARPSYGYRALFSKMARRFVKARLPEHGSYELAGASPPAWVFLHNQEVLMSATALRQEGSLLHELTESLSASKAEDVCVIDLQGRSSVADFMVIATGWSHRHVQAMARHLLDLLKPLHLNAGAEGLEQGDWVLVDAGSVIVHLFLPDVRSFYALESLWSEGGRKS